MLLHSSGSTAEASGLEASIAEDAALLSSALPDVGSASWAAYYAVVRIVLLVYVLVGFAGPNALCVLGIAWFLWCVIERLGCEKMASFRSFVRVGDVCLLMKPHLKLKVREE
jgi:hypothetical protein